MDPGTSGKTLILGLGNLLLGDEGVGVHVAQWLLQAELPSDVEVIDGGTGGFELIEHVRGRSKVIIVDCLRADARPGSVALLTLDELSLQQPASLSVHQGGVRELLRHIRDLTPAPDVVVFGVVPATVNQLSTALSAEISSQLPRIVSKVLGEAARPASTSPDSKLKALSPARAGTSTCGGSRGRRVLRARRVTSAPSIRRHAI